MKRFYIFVLISLLLAPVGIAAVSFFDDDETVCELLENLSEEEEEEDDTEAEPENKFIREFYISRSQYSIVSESAPAEYKDPVLTTRSISQEVQTPPPELS